MITLTLLEFLSIIGGAFAAGWAANWGAFFYISKVIELTRNKDDKVSD